MLDWNAIENPIVDREPKISLRDPALYYYNGTFYLFHTAVERRHFQYFFYCDLTTSTNLKDWSHSTRIINSSQGYSSPGNVFAVGDIFYLCVQTYPVPRFKQYANEDCRLWLIQSKDLIHWSEPRIIKASGAEVKWSKSPRQIDPFVLEHDQRFYCFYKTSGKIGALVSKDLLNWQELSQDQPVLSSEQLPDRATIENICIVKEHPDKSDFTMFFSPCFRKRGVGIAKSSDLLHWKFERYLDLPYFDWASSHPTAPSVIDLRKECGKWLMAFHADRLLPHGGALGLAWSEDLINWQFPKQNIPDILSLFD